jgi:hypothetical protein
VPVLLFPSCIVPNSWINFLPIGRPNRQSASERLMYLQLNEKTMRSDSITL